MKPLQPLLYLLTVSAVIGVLFAVSVPPFLQIVNLGAQTDRWWYAALFLFPYSVLVSALRPQRRSGMITGFSPGRQSQVSYRITSVT